MSLSFLELGVSAPVAGALAAKGFTHPFAIQTLVLPDGLAGLDILGESPTGSGKTLAFGLTLIERIEAARHIAALVLVPTRELALQVTADLTPIAAAKNLRLTTVYGGAGIGAQIQAVKRANVVVATPGRLFDLIERRCIDLSRVGVLVLDEADRMLDMGFKPQVDRILASVPENRQTMLFSATFDGAVAELAQRYTTSPSHVKGTRPEQAEPGEIEHSFVLVTPESKLDTLVEHLKGDRGRAIVFVRTKHGADKLARKLERQHDIPAVAMHGNLSQAQRERALRQFESGKIPTLVATDVAARGLDVDDVTHVINFDPPMVADDYVHRVGRTGRAGRSGTGVTYVLPEQRRDIAQMAVKLGHGEAYAATGAPLPQAHQPRQGGGNGVNRPGGGRKRMRGRR